MNRLKRIGRWIKRRMPRKADDWGLIALLCMIGLCVDFLMGDITNVGPQKITTKEVVVTTLHHDLFPETKVVAYIIVIGNRKRKSSFTGLITFTYPWTHRFAISKDHWDSVLVGQELTAKQFAAMRHKVITDEK